MVGEFAVSKAIIVVDFTLETEPAGESSTPEKQIEIKTLKAFDKFIEKNTTPDSNSTTTKVSESDKYTTTQTDR